MISGCASHWSLFVPGSKCWTMSNVMLKNLELAEMGFFEKVDIDVKTLNSWITVYNINNTNFINIPDDRVD